MNDKEEGYSDMVKRMNTFDEILDEFLAYRGYYNFEGDSGVRRLNDIVEQLSISYKEMNLRQGSPIELFLADNPGAVEALLDWIRESADDEWKDGLESCLPEHEEGSDE